MIMRKISTILSLMLFAAFSITHAQDLPLDFEAGAGSYAITDFDGAELTVVDNPDPTGINTSSKVAKMVKGAGQNWAGSYIDLDNPMDFDNNNAFKMKVYSPRDDAKVLLKVENSADPGQNFEKEVAVTKANEWEEIIFDYSEINTANPYDRVVLIFDLGTVGDGSANFTYYVDDIELFNYVPTTEDVSIDFEEGAGSYAITDFDGGALTVIDNPHASGINTSSKVGQMVKNPGQVWGGSYIDLENAMDFTNNNTFKMKVYSPREGAAVLLKVENSADAGINYEQEVLTTKANEWEQLTFDYSQIDTESTYDRVVIIFDNGTEGDGSENFTFLIDDIELVYEVNPASLPLGFEETRTDYTFTDFDGGVATRIDNPHAIGLNPSSKVIQMVKNAGQPWGGSYITLGEPIDFSSDTLFKMKVFSPKADAKVTLKVENIDDPGIWYEQEATTTVADKWEELTFNYSEIDDTQEYQKVAIIFENGTEGDGSADFTYLFDDIELGNEKIIPLTTTAPDPPILNPYRILTVFSDVNNQEPNTNFFTRNADTTETDIISVDGNTVIEYTKFKQITMFMEEEYDVNYLKRVHVDIYPTEEFDIYVKPVSFYRKKRPREYGDTVTLVANQWNSIDLPYEEFQRLDNGDPLDLRRFGAFRLEHDSASLPTIYVDNVYLYDDFVDDEAPENLTAEVFSKTNNSVTLELFGEDNSGEFYFDVAYGDSVKVFPADSGVTVNATISDLDPDTEYTFTITAHDNDGNESTESLTVTATTYAQVPAPSTAAPVPTYPANEVISLYSDSYDAASSWNFGFWGQETQTSYETIESNGTIKMTGVDYLGIEINGNVPAFDATTCDSLHLDVWTPNAPSLEITLISESTAGKFQAPVMVDFEAEVWNSIDIPLSDFLDAEPSLELENLIQFKFVSQDDIDNLPLDDIIYMDNILFSGYDFVDNIQNVRENENIKVYGRYGNLVVQTQEPTMVSVYNLSGKKIYEKNCDNNLEVSLETGVYIVKAGSYTTKCVITR